MIETTNQDVQSATLEIQVIRANGTIENHGLVAAYHKNKLKNALLQVHIKIRRVYTWLMFLRTQAKRS